MTAVTTWPARAESWLDDHGKPAWIAAMVVGFILFWPIGLALLAYMIWGKKMFGSNCSARRRNPMHMGGFRSSGNTAFDAYKADMLKRLEDEQEAFTGFLDRLRQSKDKAEFDAFMDERARKRPEDTRSADQPA